MRLTSWNRLGYFIPLPWKMGSTVEKCGLTVQDLKSSTLMPMMQSTWFDYRAACTGYPRVMIDLVSAITVFHEKNATCFMNPAQDWLDKRVDGED